jgi:hypothetical protein
MMAAVAIGLALALVAASCSSDDGATPGTEVTAGDQLEGPDFVAAGTDSGGVGAGQQGNPAESTTGDPVGSEVTRSVPTTTIAEVPDTGVPGLDATDDFCRAWSEFAGSFQVVATAWLITDPVDAARYELAASTVFVGARDQLAATLPGELEVEREQFIDGFLEPMTRRAEGARSVLFENAFLGEEVARLADAWRTTLARTTEEDPVPMLEAPAELGARLDAAAATYAGIVRPIAEDPTLITRVTTPLTDAYLAANCPDQGILAGGEVGPP